MNGPQPADRRLRLLLRLARLIRHGTLTLVLPDGARHVIEAGPGTSAMFIVKDARAVRRLLTGGNLGLAEAYLDGLWDTPDLRAVMRLAAANETIWEAALAGRPWMRALARLGHRLRPNTRRGARRNIVAHYDLGNDFYAAWLDRTMTYSSALFGGNDDTLEAAQLRKMHRLCQALELRPGMRVLEIGCGWGGFAEVAARDYGALVTGITLSPAQLDYAEARIARAGLAGRVDLLLEDYRDVRGSFDRIACIEMFEAVGEKYWPAFLRHGARPAGARRTRGAADHHHRRPLLRHLPARRRLHPAPRVSRRHAAERRTAARGSVARRARLVGRALVRPRLRRDAGALAGAVSGRLAAHRRRRTAAGAAGG